MAAEPDESLTLPVPDRVGAFYAVPTTDTTIDAAGLVAAALGQVEDSLPRPLPQPLLQAHRVDELPPLPLDQLAAAGATEAQLARVQAATHLILVTVGGRAGWPPAHEWLARTMAATAAVRHGTDVVDLLANRVLDLARVRTSLPDADGLVCLADWVSVECWPDRAGYACTTTGLRRFGLPEMQTLATPPNLVDAWSRAMIGLAGQLLAAWRDALAGNPEAAFVQLRPSLALTDGDLIEAFAQTIGRFGPYASAGGANAASVRLALDPGSDPHRHDSCPHDPPAAALGRFRGRAPRRRLSCPFWTIADRRPARHHERAHGAGDRQCPRRPHRYPGSIRIRWSSSAAEAAGEVRRTD